MMVCQSGRFGSIPATTWNPSDKGAGITLSGGNLIAAANATAQSAVRSTRSKTTGKHHWEVTFNAFANAGGPAIGVANATETLASMYLGFSANSTGVFALGDVYNNNSVVASAIFSISPGDTVAVELDMTVGIYFQKVGGSRQGPYTIPSGALFAAFSGYFVGDAVTVNFGATTFLVAPTSGYSAWNDT